MFYFGKTRDDGPAIEGPTTVHHVSCLDGVTDQDENL